MIYLPPHTEAAQAPQIRNPDDIARVISGLEGQPPSGFIVMPDYFVGHHGELIITLAARHRVPAVYYLPDFSMNGGLLSYGPDQHLGPSTRLLRRSHFERYRLREAPPAQ